MFAIDGLVFCYPKTPVKVLDLRGVRFDLPLGRRITLLGESGSGKSTFLALLALVWDRPPEAGTVTYWPENAEEPEVLVAPGFRLSTQRKAELRLNDFGFVPQSSYLLPHLDAITNLEIPMAWLGVPRGERARRIATLLDAARLGPKEARRKARDLSGGQRQRVAVLRVLANDPRVIFADEPFSNLDHNNAGAVMELFKDRWMSGDLSLGTPRAGRTLVVVSHAVRHAREHSDDLLVLFKGHVVLGPNGPLIDPSSVTDDDLETAIEEGEFPGAREAGR